MTDFIPQNYAANLSLKAQNFAELNDLEKVALIEILANFSPCVTDAPENLKLTTEEIKKIASPVVSLKLNDIATLLKVVGFTISVNKEMAAAWNIKRLSNPVKITAYY